MIFRYLLPPTLVMALLFVGCNSLGTNEGEKTEFERRELPREPTEQETQLINGSGKFGFSLMHQLIEDNPDKSHFISPLSIQMAYGMTMNGAEGETFTQMQQTFGMDGMSREQINETARELINLLTQFDENVQFNIANSIWYRDTFSVEDDFLETNQSYYDAEIEAADFNNPKTVDRINSWVDEKTEGLIEEIVQRPIDPLSVMYLINAIYFNGDWTIQFDPENTEKKLFDRPDGNTVETNMMQLEKQEEMLYQNGDNYEAVNLYYGDAGFAMTLVLPDEEMGLENWVNDLDWEKWQDLTGSFNNVTLTLDLPKFETEYEIEDFKKVLKKIGITDAFSAGESDFSRINSDRNDLHISDTRHKSFVRVHEEGTEAAAVTSIEMSVTSAPQSVQVSFDRPFFYIIREVESEAILFMGTMTDPS